MRCNIFKPISNDTGEFLIFSKYTEDLTKAVAAGGSYRVTPSKFAVLDLNLSNFIEYISVKEGISEQLTDISINRYISQYLQSYYENSICCAGDYSDDPAFEPEIYSDLLWKSLEDWGFINRETEDNYTYFPELHFIGDINIHSSRQVEGSNYDDIYCYISPSDKSYKYELSESNFSGLPTSGIPLNEDFNYDNEESVIYGWNFASYPVNNGGVDIHPRTDEDDVYKIYYDYEHNVKYLHPNLNDTGSPTNDEYFIFNCIIVFYDVWNDLAQEEPQLLHKGLPLGIYFTGPARIISNSEDAEITDGTTDNTPFRNQVTKYVSNEDIFGQGTGWGVRLMTRIVSTPNNTSYTAIVNGEDDYNTIASAMGQIANAIADIRTDQRLQAQNYQLMKDHLAMFKNYRVNVPYVRYINDVPYWFVNGRNTGQKVYPES